MNLVLKWLRKIASEAMEKLSEFDIIKRYFTPLANNEFSLGLADDVAKFSVNSECELVFTKDVCVAGVHFFHNDPPETIGRKALRVNISDLVAKGAQPIGYFMGIGLPVDWEENWLRNFCDGLSEDQKLFGISLLGGDTVHSPNNLFISITAIGKINPGAMCQRNTAQVGDLVYVTGTIGDSFLGCRILGKQLELADRTDTLYLTNRYLLPEPRANAIDFIQKFATASLDISDGLIADLNHLCVASGVGAEIDLNLVPVSSSVERAIKNDYAILTEIITGGDDYEVLFTIPVAKREESEIVAKNCKLQVTNIGKITAGNKLRVLESDGSEIAIPKMGFQHF